MSISRHSGHGSAYSSGFDSKDDHVRKTREVLRRLQAAGIYLDIKKCNFGVTEVKYLGFIVEAGREIRPDPEKIATIRTWERPTRVKGVRSFLGFANFYREFIPKFSDLAGPLLVLTRKGVPFAWSDACSNAFERLKAAFVSYPVLAQWDPDGQTVVEADSSGDAIGGCLSQYDARGILHPVAYHSARLTAPQRNYTIHDKELFSIKYRASRPGLQNSAYRPGSQASRPDALSRREQDVGNEEGTRRSLMTPVTIRSLCHSGDEDHLGGILPPLPGDHPDTRSIEDPFSGSEDLETPGESEEDDYPETASAKDPPTTTKDPKRPTLERGLHSGRSTSRSPSMMLRDMAIMSQNPSPRTEVRDSPEPSNGGSPRGSSLFVSDELAELWDTGVRADTTYEPKRLAVLQGERKFLPAAASREQIANCSVDAHGVLQYKGRAFRGLG
ncbi:uncharacterized protein CPUR_02932 [Claviceps purpurea 20.1]|uniref:Reverse transcriptase/retrotransposon-derived protein RNase H-like domain-containing protein n=1 Tax=Claviceps purpurea (strain 20.1) TaxID=1111077 RepID=M1WD26_CLAP2|nr:uncharacterized protein CPUR_02932 [Claviceps purpurea 20.1]